MKSKTGAAFLTNTGFLLKMPSLHLAAKAFGKEVRFMDVSHTGAAYPLWKKGIILREHGGAIVSPETACYASKYSTKNGSIQLTEITKAQYDKINTARDAETFLELFEAI